MVASGGTILATKIEKTLNARNYDLERVCAWYRKPNYHFQDGY